MPVAKITGQGLFAIGCAVALLWTCLVSERAMMRRAYEQRAEVMRGLARQQRTRNPRPASPPVVRFPRTERPAQG